MNELLSYVFSPLRKGDIALYRGSGNGLAPILLVAAEETSSGCVERLEHEYALKSELDADWAARPVALAHDNGRMTLVLEDPGGTPLDRLLGRPLEISHFLRIAIPLAGVLRLACHSAGMVLNQPALPKQAWATGVNKMINNYEAPVAPEDVGTIVDYLTALKGAK